MENQPDAVRRRSRTDLEPARDRGEAVVDKGHGYRGQDAPPSEGFEGLESRDRGALAREASAGEASVDAKRGQPAPLEQSTIDPPVEPRDLDVPAKRVLHHEQRLPNCKITGIAYQASLADALARFSPDEIKAIGIAREKTPADFAVDWNPENYEISCRPDQAGEFEIELYVDVFRHERHIFPFKLTVNPDPKSLWKNIPSDQSAVYAKPDSDRMFLACGEALSIVAASQRGRSHAQEGRPRDDDFAAAYDSQTECAILTVADGAGSARFSREGSRLATRTVLQQVKASMGREFWARLVPTIERWANEKDALAERSIKKELYVLIQAAWEAKTIIKKEAQDREARHLADYQKAERFTARDFATTLIITVAKRLGGGGWFVATFWVGDGGMGIYRPAAGEVRVQGTPDGGEYGGQTRFLTEDSAEVWPQDAHALIARRLRFDVVDSFDAVVLMTDGVSDPMFETDNQLLSINKWNDFWAGVSREVPLERRDESVADALLKWMDFWSPGNHDDRTMMVLY